MIARRHETLPSSWGVQWRLLVCSGRLWEWERSEAANAKEGEREGLPRSPLLVHTAQGQETPPWSALSPVGAVTREGAPGFPSCAGCCPGSPLRSGLIQRAVGCSPSGGGGPRGGEQPGLWEGTRGTRVLLTAPWSAERPCELQDTI